MAEESAVEITYENIPNPPPPKRPITQGQSSSSSFQGPKPQTMHDKTISSASNLMKLLPSGTVLAFQALSPSFTNRGSCYTSNKYLTYGLIFISSISCILFSFTDSIIGSTTGKVYYGVATFKGFHAFNREEEDEDVFRDLGKHRLQLLDFIHAFIGVFVFLAITLSDVEVQSCLFGNPGPNTRQLLWNLPLGAGIFASLLFTVFPTSRKGVGYSDATPHKKTSTE